MLSTYWPIEDDSLKPLTIFKFIYFIKVFFGGIGTDLSFTTTKRFLIKFMGIYTDLIGSYALYINRFNWICRVQRSLMNWGVKSSHPSKVVIFVSPSRICYIFNFDSPKKWPSKCSNHSLAYSYVCEVCVLFCFCCVWFLWFMVYRSLTARLNTSIALFRSLGDKSYIFFEETNRFHVHWCFLAAVLCIPSRKHVVHIPPWLEKIIHSNSKVLASAGG